MRTRWAVAAVVVGAALAFGCGAGGEEDNPFVVGEYTPPPSVTPSVDDGSRGDGVYEVGTGIMAGKWSTTASATGFGCYWQRSKDASGSFDAIIANGNLPKGAPGVVQIAATDKFVTFSGGCRWTKTG